MKGNNSRYATSQVLCTVCSTQYVPMFCLLGLERNYITHKPEWDRSDKQTDVEAESFEAVAKERRGLGYKRPVAPPAPPFSSSYYFSSSSSSFVTSMYIQG